MVVLIGIKVQLEKRISIKQLFILVRSFTVRKCTVPDVYKVFLHVYSFWQDRFPWLFWGFSSYSAIQKTLGDGRVYSAEGPQVSVLIEHQQTINSSIVCHWCSTIAAPFHQIT